MRHDSDGQLFPVSQERHGERRWRRFESYAFAGSMRAVPLSLAEIDAAAAALPVGLADRPGGPVAVALLRPAAGGPAPFVGPGGRWRGTYVPAALRVHPFSARVAGDDGQMVLLVDEGTGLVGDDPQGEPFFDANGQPARLLAEVVDFLRAHAGSEMQARRAAAALAQAGLLRPMTAQAGMAAEDAEGFLCVDPQAFEGLPETALADLWRCGALRLAQAQLVSQHHFGWIARALAAGLGDTVSIAARPADTAEADIGGFLSALAASHAADRGGAS